MSAQSRTDAFYMAHAIRLAERGRYTTDPNPRVGCVLVREGEIVGEGAHMWAGEPHAEIHAIMAAGDRVRGATAYVTLEPCSHYGRTPPCSKALIDAGIARLVVAMTDPNPQVAGRGFQMCRDAGIEVVEGVLEEEARALNRGFIARMTGRLPYTRLKMAMSLDGRTAMASGESQWITGAAARCEVQRLRASSSAVVTGIGSILDDDSRLTVRAEPDGVAAVPCEPGRSYRQPLRVVVDSTLRMPVDAQCLSEPGATLVATTSTDADKRSALEQAGASCLVLPANAEGRVDLVALWRYLGDQEACNDILLETGATLAGEALTLGLVDELHLFMAPTLMGGQARPLFELGPLAKMSDQRRLLIEDVRAFGSDWRILARPEAVANTRLE
ncbi:bifunctional diaminohydroxyphosphoribosylaminopyrimidine deaminase/5-amino-6-(5-phosphoribosylamino)uracil reductase RibD [Larsenimonas suaedae]|uniref:Riboflavin biosynthesis protein RibD n=1 Tax=Larsenimonas suaedae TaxID=1851019 RepID=A0ABU1GWJ2_9GAMM|nr:bifunctional diaminohydroxyphosphoribosylaminopyrimidine deaminase/5-amino-6-(5-phosphoribosylamino)uracil reductase RibD [Larsenimonas suaedae]MCM2972962.1 bifunctional diaminohydroxyphosphoribosylaminopyrimidine deaminase/5-amino-6-(5-phosphoribosylamino)uracil reductase RibD [Larsenimonas suaedae]MDR5896399.1 bifunctional diaminohydroxyphosphoribosylaminopyrimidine deaminase/5-amino-6-(5-phosphoribosylamino)uracil reductase RibD [Larsenimonas suaedae]